MTPAKPVNLGRDSGTLLSSTPTSRCTPARSCYEFEGTGRPFPREAAPNCRQGRAFDTVSGLPDSLRGGKAALSFLELALKYVDARWVEASAKQRDSMTDSLATAVPVLVKPVRGRPTLQLVRRALRSYVLPVPRRDRERPEEIAAAVRWIERASLPVAELQEIVSGS
jgi:hypothetical protein